MSHFLDFYDTKALVGFGKNFRGIIHTDDTPTEDECLHGVLLSSVDRENATFISTISTSTVLRVQPLVFKLTIAASTSLYLVETRNSTYLAVLTD
jgi:hypothetical protein